MLVATRDHGYFPNSDRTEPKVYSPSRPDASATLVSLREKVKELVDILDDKIDEKGVTVLGLSRRVELLGAGCSQLRTNHEITQSTNRKRARSDVTLVENSMRREDFHYGSVYASSGNASLNLPNTPLQGFALDWALIRVRHGRQAGNVFPNSDVFEGGPGTNVLDADDHKLEPGTRVYKKARRPAAALSTSPSLQCQYHAQSQCQCQLPLQANRRSRRPSRSISADSVLRATACPSQPLLPSVPLPHSQCQCQGQRQQHSSGPASKLRRRRATCKKELLVVFLQS